MSHFIYADHAATTAVSDTALQAMLPHFTTAFPFHFSAASTTSPRPFLSISAQPPPFHPL